MRGGRTLETVLTFLAYLVFGVLAGIVGTVAHRARIDVLGVQIWFGWAVGLLAVLALAIGLRLYLGDRLPGYGFAIGVCLAVLVFTLGGAGQSVMIPAAANGLGAGEAWTFGSAIAAFVPVIWPRLARRAPRDE
ncbi:hypothetical protein [Gulosibacter sp. 10]|uniref:hypothetical protein n=1 Tax=Gulosibacter sp. 10 TaxID=1255570 RepID=UPI00097EF303|nr:hypothetical protein [Gulosibacter sp. 10]SJM56689.1 fragment [Gulosibacter sp. 10]